MIKNIESNIAVLQKLLSQNNLEPLYKQAIESGIEVMQKFHEIQQIMGPSSHHTFSGDEKSKKARLWTVDEEANLKIMWREDKLSLGYISEQLDRSEIACLLRLEKIGVLKATQDELAAVVTLVQNHQEVIITDQDQWVLKAKRFEGLNPGESKPRLKMS